MYGLRGADLRPLSAAVAGFCPHPRHPGAQLGAGFATGVSHQHLLRAVLGGAETLGQRD